MKQVSRDVSVIICTYTEERWDALLAAVDSVRAQSVQPREIIIVVDHNPTLLARAHEQCADAIVIENRETRGLSGARNSGVATAQGALVAFLDDDAVAETTWLQGLTDCCDDPQVLGAGTLIAPLWESEHPAWLPEEFYWVVGCTYRGLPLTTAPVRNLFGGSMCVRREIFAEIGGFRSGIGRVSAHPLGCEETELCIRARQRWPHKVFIYEPHVRIQHRVPASRTGWTYFRARCYAEGQSKAMISRTIGVGDGLASEWAYAWKTLPQGVMHGLADTVFRRDRMGLVRAGAIVGGLALTIAGYFQEWILQRTKNRLERGENIAIAARESEE